MCRGQCQVYGNVPNVVPSPSAVFCVCETDRQTDRLAGVVSRFMSKPSIVNSPSESWLGLAGWVSTGVCHEVKVRRQLGLKIRRLSWAGRSRRLCSHLSWASRRQSETLGRPMWQAWAYHSVVVSRQLDFLDSGWLLQNTHAKSSRWKLQGFL